jgi:amino acid transporter
MTDAPAKRKRLSQHAAWAMAVGGMIGGGIYTLAGVILGLAGSLAWLSLLLGSLIALATGRSYARLTFAIAQEGVPVASLVKKERYHLASVVAWWLMLVYVLATAVYAYTLGQYVGRALGASPAIVIVIIGGAVLALVLVNLIGIHEPSGVQIAAVWIELAILAAIAALGLLRYDAANVARGVPAPSVMGVISGMAATFIAFEGFEMLAYDVRELRHPIRTLKRGLPAAVIAVAIAYALVTMGAASLVGADVLVRQKENALAVAGERAAGGLGLFVVTLAACASATSAINATLFSVARLARTAAEGRLVPGIFKRTNRNQIPYWGLLLLGSAAACLAAVSSLEPLVQAASLAFLVLFAFVNLLAFVESKFKDPISLVAGIASLGAAIVVARQLILAHPLALAGFALVWALSLVAHWTTQWRRRARGGPDLTEDPVVQEKRKAVIGELRTSKFDESA